MPLLAVDRTRVFASFPLFFPDNAMNFPFTIHNLNSSTSSSDLAVLIALSRSLDAQCNPLIGILL